MFTEALFTVIEKWKQPKRLSRDKWVKCGPSKQRNTNSSAEKRNEALTHRDRDEPCHRAQ